MNRLRSFLNKAPHSSSLNFQLKQPISSIFFSYKFERYIIVKVKRNNNVNKEVILPIKSLNTHIL